MDTTSMSIKNMEHIFVFGYIDTVKTRNKVEGAPGQGTLAILTFARCLLVVPLNPFF